MKTAFNTSVKRFYGDKSKSNPVLAYGHRGTIIVTGDVARDGLADSSLAPPDSKAPR